MSKISKNAQNLKETLFWDTRIILWLVPGAEKNKKGWQADLRLPFISMEEKLTENWKGQLKTP